MSGAARSVNAYYTRSYKAASFMNRAYRAAAPEDWEVRSKEFEKGRWLEHDPGPWLGRALLWKLQVSAHRDITDGKFHLGGKTNEGDYDGGTAVYPDFGLKLRLVTSLNNEAC